MNDQSNGALNPTNTAVSALPTKLPIHDANAVMASFGGSPVLANFSSEKPPSFRALGSAFRFIGCSSHENVRVGSSTSHAPIDKRLYSPGMGPAASTSIEIKTSR